MFCFSKCVVTAGTFLPDLVSPSNVIFPLPPVLPPRTPPPGLHRYDRCLLTGKSYCPVKWSVPLFSADVSLILNVIFPTSRLIAVVKLC